MTGSGSKRSTTTASPGKLIEFKITGNNGEILDGYATKMKITDVASFQWTEDIYLKVMQALYPSNKAPTLNAFAFQVGVDLEKLGDFFAGARKNASFFFFLELKK